MNHFAKIAEKLSAYELDGMLLTCEANRFYASGFHSTGTDGVALVTREGNFYFTDSRYIEAAHNKVQDAEIAMTDAAHPYVDLINAAMEKTHVQKLGFEDAYMTVADYRHYSEKLHCQLVPATELLISLRQSKDEEEIQRMIAAQRIAEAALDQIVKEIKPGVTEKEIAARLQYLMLAGGAENMSFDPIVASGPNGSMPHAVPTDRKIQDGDFVTMDFGCIYQGYCSDMTRTVAVGRVTEEMEKVYNVVLQAQLAGIAAAKAGIIKPGSPVVSYGGVPEADAVIARTAAERHAPLTVVDLSRLTIEDGDLDAVTFDFDGLNGIRLPLIGSYQPRNAATAITALRVLRSRGWNIPDSAIRAGLEQVRWPGRFELLRHSPVFLLDGSHNAHGMRATVQSLRDRFPGQKFVFLLSIMADKDVDEMLALLLPLAGQFVTVAAHTPRAMPAETLAEQIRARGGRAEPAPTIEAGVARAVALGGTGPVCALGTLYFSGDVREAFAKLNQ